MENEMKLAEKIQPDLEPGEKLIAATDADHRGTGGAVVGFLFSGLFSNLVEKADAGKTVDEETNLPLGPVVVAVTDRRVLFFSRDVDPKLGPIHFVVGLPPEAVKGARHGRDPLTDTLLIDFADDSRLVLSLDTFNHSGAVIKAIRHLCGLAEGTDDTPEATTDS